MSSKWEEFIGIGLLQNTIDEKTFFPIVTYIFGLGLSLPSKPLSPIWKSFLTLTFLLSEFIQRASVINLVYIEISS